MGKEFNYAFIVEGMSCNHCRMSVEKAVMSMDGVSSVNIDLATGKVMVKADNLDTQQLGRKLEMLGYTMQQSS